MLNGAVLGVFASAGRRLAHPHAAFGLREPRVAVEGRADQLAVGVAQHQQQLGYLHEHLARACGQPVRTIASDMRAGLVLAAADAIGYGLVHELARSRRSEER